MRLHTLSALLATFLFAVSASADETGNPPIIVTASPGGIFYVYGKGLAALLTKYLGSTFRAEATQGTPQNIVLVEQHKAMLGLALMGAAWQAWHGIGWANGTEHRSIRAVFPMYDNPFQFVAPQRLKLASLEGFAGKRIGDGPKGGTPATYIPKMFNTLGIEATFRNGAFEDNMQQVASGEIDGLALVVGIPAAGLAELDAQLPLDYLQPSPDQVALVRKEFPEISPSLVPAGTYPSLTTDYHTFGIYGFVVVNEDLPDNLVYKIVKAVFEHHQELVDAHPAAKETVPANVDRDAFLPFHPGAVRYYREIGVDIPAALAARGDK
jgi:TRAP transporter TAXI family solute receptor